MAPEMVQNKPHDAKIDIWSLGVLLYELIHGQAPFRGKTTEQKFKEILSGSFTIASECSDQCKDLIRKLLRADPADRPSFDEIFAHPWVKNYEKEFNIKISQYVYDPSKRKRRTDKKPEPQPEPEKKNPPMNQDTSQMLNDTMNTSTLDTSAVHFEPVTLRKHGNANSSFISSQQDNSVTMKLGDPILTDLYSGNTPRTNKFTGEIDQRVFASNQPGTQMTRSISPSNANTPRGMGDQSSQMGVRRSKSSIFGNENPQQKSVVEEMKAEVEKFMNTSASKLSTSQDKIDLTQSRLDSSFDKSLNTTNPLGERKRSISPSQVASDDRNQKLLKEMDNRIKGTGPKVEISAQYHGQTPSLHDHHKSFAGSTDLSPINHPNMNSRNGGRSPLKIDADTLRRIERDISRSKSPTDGQRSVQQSAAQSKISLDLSLASNTPTNRNITTPIQKDLSPRNISTQNTNFPRNTPTSTQASVIKLVPMEETGMKASKFLDQPEPKKFGNPKQGMFSKQQDFDDTTEEGPGPGVVAVRVSQTPKGKTEIENEQNRLSRNRYDANASPNRGKSSEVNFHKVLDTSFDESSQLNKSFDLGLLHSSKQPQTPDRSNRRSFIFDKSPSNQEQADKIRAEMGNILSQIDEPSPKKKNQDLDKSFEISSTSGKEVSIIDREQLALKQELSFQPTRKPIFDNKVSKSFSENTDEIPDESDRRGRDAKPRTSDISEKQTRASASPARISYVIDPKSILPSDLKKEGPRYSKISDFIRKKDDREVTELCDRIFSQRERERSPDNVASTPKNTKPMIFADPPKSPTHHKPVQLENTGFSHSIASNNERVTQSERITNIDHYIKQHLEDNEELQVLSKLEFMSTTDMSKSPRSQKKGIFDHDDRENKFKAQMQEDMQALDKSPTEKQGSRSPLKKSSRAGSTKSNKAVRFEMPEETEQKNRKNDSKASEQGSVYEDEDNIRQFSFGKKHLEESLGRSFNSEDSAETSPSTKAKRGNKQSGDEDSTEIRQKSPDAKEKSKHKSTKSTEESFEEADKSSQRKKSPLTQEDDDSFTKDKSSKKKRDNEKKSKRRTEEDDDDDNYNKASSKDLDVLKSKSEPITYDENRYSTQDPRVIQKKAVFLPKKQSLTSDIKSDSSSEDEERSGRKQNTLLKHVQEKESKSKRQKSPLLRLNREDIPEAENESDYTRSKSTQKYHDWSSVNASQTDRPMRAVTPTLSPKKLNTSFSKQQPAAPIFNYREFQAKSQDMSRDDLLKFYQHEMSRLESSIMTEEVDQSLGRSMNNDDDEDEVVATYEIDTSRSMNALRNRKNAKRAKENSGANLNHSNLHQQKQHKKSDVQSNYHAKDGTVDYQVDRKMLQATSKGNRNMEYIN